MEKKKKSPMSARRFALIFFPITSVLLIVSIVAMAVMGYYENVMNEVFGSAQMKIVGNDEGTDYYGKKAGSKEQSVSAALELSLKAEEEGIVLLKNENDTLPLRKSDDGMYKVNAFGWGFYHPVYGGTGSGSVDESICVTPKEGLENSGIEINASLKTAYESWSQETGNTSRPVETNAWGYVSRVNWRLPEMSISDGAYDVGDAATYSDTAIFWIARQGGEGFDLATSMDERSGLTPDQFGYDEEKHYLELTDEEREVLDAIKQNGAIKHIIVVINSSNQMELKDLRDDDRVDSIVWVGCPAQEGFKALGEVLTGEVNPSGYLPDIYYADFKADPTFVNFSDPDYYNEGNAQSGPQTNKYGNVEISAENYTRYAAFVQYEEGIYVGYRYYETAAALNETGFTVEGEGGKTYDDAVAYPFGYGLSYTTFEQNIVNAEYKDGIYVFDVEVQNVGGMAGKSVVQLYVETPYTEYDAECGIQKAKVVLAGFDKTEVLEPGETETVRIMINEEDIASYDSKVNKAYVLDAGDYTFYLGTVEGQSRGSHSWAFADVKDSGEANGAEKVGAVVFRNAVEDTIVFDSKNRRSSDKQAAKNALDDNMVGMSGQMTLLDRANWENTQPEPPTDEDRTASEELLAYLQPYDVLADNDESDEMPATGENHDIQLINMRGVDYDDPKWDEYVEQFTVEEMESIVTAAGFNSKAVARLGKTQTSEQDGPGALKSQGLGSTFTEVVSSWPSEVVLASTWNVELLEDIGEAIGEEGLQYGVNGWYAPGLNTHRSPFGGRNFEYFSEDGVLSGKLCAAEVSGAASKGVYAYAKHFALNEQEAYRNNESVGSWQVNVAYPPSTGADDVVLLVWADEQTIREIYLKSYEILVKEAKTTICYVNEAGEDAEKEIPACMGIMSSFTCLGNTWCGASGGLLQTILRDEWGFKGSVITDAQFYYFMDTEKALRNGGDVMLNTGAQKLKDSNSATAVLSLQQAVKNTCYTQVNSNAVNDIGPKAKFTYTMAPWKIANMAGIAVASVLFLFVVIIYAKKRKDEKAESSGR